MLRRLPIESAQPVVLFAAVRVAVVVIALAAVLALGVPYGGRALFVIGGLGLPWTVGVLLVARRHPEAALNPAVAAGDLALLLALELLVPEAYGAVRFTALFLIAVHAHFQGERWGLAVAALGVVGLVAPFAVRGGGPVRGELLAFYETVFAVLAMATGLLVGLLRTTESASRLRAVGLSRRTMQAEAEARRRVAESIHDGPVQELIGLGMLLSAARAAAEGGDRERAESLLREAGQLTERNVQALRDEIVDLGPYAFDQMTLPAAIEKCLPAWERRYDARVRVDLEPLELTREMAGGLFRIVQEAVTNAGRHADARNIEVSVQRAGGQVELRVSDDGSGFDGADPLAADEPGHLGLASMRERARLLDGRLEIETSERGTSVVVRAPLPVRAG